MAVVSVEQMKDGTRLGLWHFDEEPQELASLHPSLQLLHERWKTMYRSKIRIMEKMAVHALLMAIDGLTADDSMPVIQHQASGCPFLDDGRHISISHTKGYAAVMVSPEHPVGIDIEYRSDRVAKIAHMFLRDDEPATTIDEQLLVWCAKEAAYKMFSSDKLSFEQMKVALPIQNSSFPIAQRPFNIQHSTLHTPHSTLHTPHSTLNIQNSLQVTNLVRQQTVNLCYRFENDYVLVFSA